MPRQRRTYLLLIVFLLAFASQACGISGPRAQQLSSSPTEPPALIATSTVEIPTIPSVVRTPRVAATSTEVATPMPPAVSITAVGGDLAIRTGPATNFDAIATLPAGKSLPVYARSIEDGWLQVPIPSQRGTVGWISTKTGFSQVDGYVLDLPLITTVEWPFGAYLVNCTSHALVAQPGDKPVPPVNGPGSNRVWFFPGLYTLYDVDVSGRPEVTQVKLFEHTTVTVVKDGAGTKYTCP